MGADALGAAPEGPEGPFFLPLRMKIAASITAMAMIPMMNQVALSDAKSLTFSKRDRSSVVAVVSEGRVTVVAGEVPVSTAAA